MADMYWDGTTSSDPTNVNNWSDTDGGGTPAIRVPGTGDVAHFTANGNPNACTATAGWALGGLSVEAGYTPKIDLVTFDLTMDDGADITLAGGGIFDAGTGTISVTNGTFSNVGQTTYDDGTSTLTFDGTCTLTSSAAKDLRAITVNAGAVVTADTFDVTGLLTLNGTLSISGTGTARTACSLAVGATGTLTGAGSFVLNSPGAGEGVTTFTAGGTIDIATFQIANPTHAGVLMAAGTYGSALVKINNTSGNAYSLHLNGAYTFSGNLELENSGVGSLTLNNSTNDPDITIQGNLIQDEKAGTVAITAGTGTWTFSGSNTQAVDFADDTIGNLVVNKTGTNVLTFADGWTAASYTHTAGVVDYNGETFSTGAGAFTIASGGDTSGGATAMNGVSITCGNFSASGSPGDYLNLLASAAWTITASGTATASNVSVSNSDASGGTAVTATDSHDGGTNTSWTFAADTGGMVGISTGVTANTRFAVDVGIGF